LTLRLELGLEVVVELKPRRKLPAIAAHRAPLLIKLSHHGGNLPHNLRENNNKYNAISE
jgi:hypothetical protein